MKHHLPWLRRGFPLSKRRQILLALGFLWTLLGVGNFVEPPPPSWATVPMLHDLPVELFGLSWTITGSVAIFYALRPPRMLKDGVGFLALYAMPAYSAAAFLIAWLDYLVDGYGSVGYSRGWLAALIYLGLVAAVMICSDWDEPTGGNC